MFNSKFLFYLLMPITLVAGSVMGQTIVIDPGHGGKSYLGTQKERNMSSPNNAATPSGIKEKELTLAFSLELEKAILAEADKLGRKGVEVFLTRRDDVNLNFTERARFCAGKSPDVIISIHFNASKSGRGWVPFV